MGVEFKNAAPRFISRGASDKSTRVVLKGESGIPQHLGKFYIWAKKGPTEPQLLSPDDLKRMYGDETFDYIHKWFNHQTRFVTGSSGEANQVMVQRLVPSDAGVRSNVNLYMDVLETQVPNYLRYSNGDIVMDANGVKQVNPKNPKIKGYKIKFITETNKDEEPTQEGLLTAKEGTMSRTETTVVDSETETEIILVPSETEFEDKTVIVEGEFVYVEEDHPTEKEIKLVPSETEFEIKYEDSTTEFETKMVGTGKFEEKTVRDPSLDTYQDGDIKDITKITDLKIDSITLKPGIELLAKHREALVEAGITNLKVKTQTGAKTPDTDIITVLSYKALKDKFAKLTLDAVDAELKVINFNGNKDITNSYIYTCLYEGLYSEARYRITKKETSEVEYFSLDSFNVGNQLVLDATDKECRLKKQEPSKFNIPADYDFGSETSEYILEVISETTLFPNLNAGGNLGYKEDFTLVRASTLRVTSFPKPVAVIKGMPLQNFKCKEDLEACYNPDKKVNIKATYKRSSTDDKEVAYLNTTDLTKMYKLELDKGAGIYKFVEYPISELGFAIPTKEELEVDYAYAPSIFNYDTPGVAWKRIEGEYVMIPDRVITIANVDEDPSMHVFTELKDTLATPTEITLNLTNALFNPEGKFIKSEEFIEFKAGEGKVLPEAFLKDIIDNPGKYYVKSPREKILVEGFKTVNEEIMEPVQVPKKVEVKVPKMVEVEVPKRVSVKKPKTKVIQVPKMVEVEVPKKVEIQTKVKSIMYPIMEVRAKYQGEYYNNLGFSINTNYLDKFNNEMAAGTKMFPYTLSLWNRKSKQHIAEQIKTFTNENEVEFLLTSKPVRNPQTDELVDFNTVYKNNWYNETSPILDYRPFEFDYFKIYEDNINSLLTKFLTSEQEYIDFIPKQYKDGIASNIEWYDFKADKTEDLKEQFKLINPFSCRTSKNVRLQTIQLSEDRPELRGNLKEVNVSSNKVIFLDGGSDGTLSNEEFERLFRAQIDKYEDMDSEVQSMAVNKESTLWDSGFTLETKKYFPKFISKRKDTWCVLSTHDASLGNKYFNLAQSRAIAATLNTAFKLSPESTFYGTPVARGQIVMGAGKLEDGSSEDYVALTYELLLMVSRFAGASDGKWKREYLFDKMPNNIIRKLKDIQPAFIPEGFKAMLWESNLVYAQNSDRHEYFFPAQQTVYPNDTSVLNNIFAIIALATSVKCSFEVWQEFTGDTELTPLEFKAAVENRLTEKITGRFAGLIDVEVECIIDSGDAARGYSWKHVIRLFGNVMKTVCININEMYRKAS